VIHSINKVEDDIRTDDPFAARVQALRVDLAG
jgi:hypothetical protein